MNNFITMPMKFIFKILVLIGLIVIGKYLKEEDRNAALANNRVSVMETEASSQPHSILLPASEPNLQNQSPFVNPIPFTTTENTSTIIKVN